MCESEHSRRSARSGELPPGKLDVIYTSGFPPVWQIWRRKGMVTIQPSRAQREVAGGVERGGEVEAEHSARSGELPPGKLDVIYIGGFPPVWQIWRRKGMVTIQPSEARREAANGVEWGDERREAETMAELANRDEQSAKSEQAERGKQFDDSQEFDVIYIGGIPPLRQIWADIKTVIRQRRELRQRR